MFLACQSIMMWCCQQILDGFLYSIGAIIVIIPVVSICGYYAEKRRLETMQKGVEKLFNFQSFFQKPAVAPALKVK